MKKVFDYKTFISLALDKKSTFNELFIGSVEGGLSSVLNDYRGGKVEVFMLEKDFKKIGTPIVEKLKALGVNVSLVLISDGDYTYLSVKSAFESKVSLAIGVGDKYLLSAVRYYSSINKTPCVAVVSSPSFDRVFCKDVYLKTKGANVVFSCEKFKKVIVDESLILKSRSENFAEAYACSVKKLTSLIDYKLNAFLSGVSIDQDVFALAKKGINFALSAPQYQNGKSAIIAAQTVFSVVNGQTDALVNSGAETLAFALSEYAQESKECKREIVSFEKTLKLYHAFFSNDFSSLLASPDYFSDIEKLEKDFKLSKSFFTKNLKIPS